jgi:hypothetical protein
MPTDRPSANARPSGRALRIRTILDARFSLSTLEAWKKNDPQAWDASRNDMGRGLYGQAMREWRRLEAVTDEELRAELEGLKT